MPRLITCIPCEKVIEGKDNSVSLVSLMYGAKIRAGVIGNDNIHPGVPMRWAIFTLWASEPDDAGHDFEQLIEMQFPSGATAFRQTIHFQMENDFHRVIAHVNTFPVSEAGQYVLIVSIKTQAGVFNELQRLPFAVSHHPIESIGKPAE